ncbi:MAG TPA: class I adenylate-forming enzyme family protein [Egicoccus sp.]|nr:class I adenylate-forming enzyme family protein [Egicoccus sp.]HSK24665.1 class I adenylate-forming enzyme family protein [Egicoccus sp.]
MQDLGAAALVRGRGVHLGDLTAVLERRYGDRPAVEDPAPTPGREVAAWRSFRDLEAVVGRFARVLDDDGVRSGQRVLVAIDNRLDVALLTFALARLGAVAVPVNHRLAPGEFAAIARAADAVAAVADPDVVPRLPDGLAVRDAADIGHRAVDAEPMGPTGGDPRETAVLLATSGTTGTPKAAALTSRGLLGALGRLAVLPVGRGGGLRGGRDLVLATLPLTHVMGFSVLLGSLSAGVPLVRRSRFDAVETLELIERRRPNVVVGVPTMYADLEAAIANAGGDAFDLSSVQLWISSADAMPLDRARRFQRYGAIVQVAGRRLGSAAFVDIYGMVELSGPAAVRVLLPGPAGPLPTPPVAVALPGVQVRAVDEQGRPVRPGRTGELQWRGGSVLRRYEGQHDQDSPDAGNGPDEVGWFASGDVGRVWRGGVLQISGRNRDRLKVGGFSVFPAEVEHELRGAPGVRELAIVGLPDDRSGERVVAAVVPAADFDADRFLTWAAEQTAGYRRPREAVVVDAIPRGNHGKIDRAATTDLVAAHLDDEPATGSA